MNDGLKDKYRQTLIDILAANPRVERVVLLGSRAMGTHSPESDIDLALYGDNLTFDDLSKLNARIEETNIPQQVDLVLAHDIDNKKLMVHIREHGVEWFRREENCVGKDGGVGNEWNYLPFTEAVEVNPSVPLQRGKIYPFVEMKAVESSSRGASGSEFREFKSGGARFMPFDTLMARITPCLENGKIARYIPSEGVDGPAFGSTEFIVIRGREGITDNDYAYYLTKWEEFCQFAISQMTGSSGRQRVPADSLAKFLAPVPESLSEQRTIAHILGTLDDKIELNRQMNRTLEAMAQALFKSWFIDLDPVVVNALRAGNPVPERFAERAAHYRDNPDALRLPEDTLRQFPDRFQDSELGPIPEGWKAQKLGNVIDVHDSKRIPLNSRQRAKRKGPYRYYGASGIMDYVDDYIFDGTYILVGEDGTVIDKGDRPVVQYVWGKFWVNNHAHVLSGNNGVSNEHLYLILKNTNVRPFVTGAVQPKISQTNLKRIPITLPKEEVRKSFSDSTKTLFTKYRQNSEECGLLEKLRDTLLPKLISGELRVPDAEKLLEDAL